MKNIYFVNFVKVVLEIKEDKRTTDVPLHVKHSVLASHPLTRDLRCGGGRADLTYTEREASPMRTSGVVSRGSFNELYLGKQRDVYGFYN